MGNLLEQIREEGSPIGDALGAQARERGFSLAAEAASPSSRGSFNDTAQLKKERVSYKAVLKNGHAQFTADSRNILVVDVNKPGAQPAPVNTMAVKRFCDMIGSGQIVAKDDHERENAGLLQRVIEASSQQVKPKTPSM